MNLNLSIRIKRRTQPQWLCRMIIVLPFVFGTLIDLLRIPAGIKYILDFAWVSALILLIPANSHVRTVNAKFQTLSLWLWPVFFAVYAVLLYIPNYQSGLYLLWGIRNNFRYYVAFAAFSTFLSTEDVNDYFGFFEKLFWLNAVVMMVQYFALEIDGDHLGGLFGTDFGCNGYTNLFMAVVLTRSAVMYLEGQEKLKSCAFKYLTATVLAALAELKGFFIEAIVIVVMAVVLTNFSWRKIGFALAGILTILIGSSVLVLLFPGSTDFLTIEKILKITGSTGGYTSTGDLNRLTALSEIDNRFFDTWSLKLFGYGLGNCDVASYDFLTTPFYVANGWIHYTWLSTAFMYLETGWIGLIFFFGFFVLAYMNARKIERVCTGVSRTYCRIAKIMAILCVVVAIYNSSLRTEAGYMAYFVLSVPSIVAKNTPSVKSVDASVG